MNARRLVQRGRLVGVFAVVLGLLFGGQAIAVTVGDLPQLTGDVFAGQIVNEDLVAIVVFNQMITGHEYILYNYDPVEQKLTQLAKGTAEVLAPHSQWRARAKTSDPWTVFSETEGTLHADGVDSNARRVDYSQPSTPLESIGIIGCLFECYHNGCCSCCVCAHRALGVPVALDRICCLAGC